MNERDERNLATLRRSIPESSVQSAIRDLLVMHGAVVIRINSGAKQDGERYTPFNRWTAPGHRDEQAGVPDLLVMFRGQALAIEVKRPGGRLSFAQAAFQRAWECAGGWYILADSVEAVQQELGI